MGVSVKQGIGVSGRRRNLELAEISKYFECHVDNVFEIESGRSVAFCRNTEGKDKLSKVGTREFGYRLLLWCGVKTKLVDRGDSVSFRP